MRRVAGTDAKAVRELFKRGGLIGWQPPLWATIGLVLASAGGEPGRRASKRGCVCCLSGAVVANLILKPMFRKPQPRQRGRRILHLKAPFLESTFPSGHTASGVAMTLGAAQELPGAGIPLGLLAIMGQRALVRDGKHFTIDIVAGWGIGLAVVLATNRLWPSANTRNGAVFPTPIWISKQTSLFFSR